MTSQELDTATLSDELNELKTSIVALAKKICALRGDRLYNSDSPTVAMEFIWNEFQTVWIAEETKTYRRIKDMVRKEVLAKLRLF